MTMSRKELLERIRSQGYIVTEEGRIGHRDVYERAHGRIPAGWVVHHINFIKDDNAVDNLIALPGYFHDFIHKKMREESRQWTRAETEQAFADHQEKLQKLKARLTPIDEQLARLEAEKRNILEALDKLEQRAGMYLPPRKKKGGGGRKHKKKKKLWERPVPDSRNWMRRR